MYWIKLLLNNYKQTKYRHQFEKEIQQAVQYEMSEV
jgi:hypothetical protein